MINTIVAFSSPGLFAYVKILISLLDILRFIFPKLFFIFRHISPFAQIDLVKRHEEMFYRSTCHY